MGRTPAENAENAEVYWEGEDSHIGAVSRNRLGLLNRDISPPEKKQEAEYGTYPPLRQVAKATAPSAGGSPGPDGEDPRRERRERRERRGVLGGGRQPHRSRFQELPWPAESGSGSESEFRDGIGIDSCSGWHLALMDRSNFTAEWCQHRNNTVAVPGFSCLNPSTSPFDTETDSDPDPDFTSPLTFSDGLYAARKRHRALCGRLSGAGWESGCLFSWCAASPISGNKKSPSKRAWIGHINCECHSGWHPQGELNPCFQDENLAS